MAFLNSKSSSAKATHKSLLHDEPFVSRALRGLYEWRPLPVAKPIYIDGVWVLFFVFAQEVLLARILPIWCKVDLVTPWLLLSTIVRPVSRNIFQFVFACVLLESLGTEPFMTYICAYAFPIFFIPIIRPNLTWTFYAPWFATFFGGLLWVHSVKFIVFSVLIAPQLPPAHYLLQSACAIVFGVMIGSVLCQPYQTHDVAVIGGSE